MKTTISAFQTSLEASKILQNSISLEFPFNILDLNENSNKVSRIWKEADNKRNLEEIPNLIQSLPPNEREHSKTQEFLKSE